MSHTPELQAREPLVATLPPEAVERLDYIRHTTGDRVQAAGLVAIIAVGTLTGMGIAAFSGKTSGGYDLARARQESHALTLAFDKNMAIDIGTAYNEEKLTATGIQEHVGISSFLTLGKKIPLLPPKVNKELDAPTATKYEIPGKAITTSVDKRGKIDLEVDVTQLEATTSYVDAMPPIRNFTITRGGQVNYGDQSGFRYSADNLAAKILAIVNIDRLNNTMQSIDDSVNHDLALEGLEQVQEQCTAQLEPTLQSVAKTSITNFVFNTLHEEDRVGSITFTGGTWKWNKPTLPAAVTKNKSAKYASSYTKPVPKLDATTCDVSKVQAGVQANAQ